MKTALRFVLLFGLIISLLLLSAAQEISKRKCDEYSRINEMQPEPNEYRKYMDKFVIAKTLFKEYDAVLISEDYALTSVPSSNALQFTSIVVNNVTIDATNQMQQDGIYLIKLRFSVELYHKIVCLWNREELPIGYNFFTMVREAGIRGVPFLRTYFPYINCPIVNPQSDQERDNFCLRYEKGRQSETVFDNPTASSLIYLKSFKNDAGLNKNHYIMGVLKQTDTIYGRKIWPNLRWIENVVWRGISDRNAPPLLEPECGTVIVPDANKQLISKGKKTYLGEFPWQAAIFEKLQQPTQNENYLCGGSLLNRDTVLTAAHCVVNGAGEVRQRAQFTVRMGLYNLDGTESMIQIFGVHAFILHELYNSTAYDSDIAIVKLNSLVTYNEYVRPICIIDNTRVFSVAHGIVAGWGRNEMDIIPNDQRKGTLLIPTRNECRHASSDAIKELLTEANYCAAHSEGQNVCRGDSGSGMITEYNNRWYVRGIVSFGGIDDFGVCNPNEFSLFTNTTYFYDWIRSKMN